MSGTCEECGDFFLGSEADHKKACGGKSAQVRTKTCEVCKRLYLDGTVHRCKTCEACKGVLVSGADHDCPFRLASAPPRDVVEEEEAYRKTIVESGTSTAMVLPRPSARVVAVAREIYFALLQTGLPEHGTIAVAEMSNSNLSFSCSGQPGSLKVSAILDFVRELQTRAFPWKLSCHSGASAVAGALLGRRTSTKQNQYGSKNVNEVCAEPKLVDALASPGSGISMKSLVVLWVGTTANKYPMTKDSGSGSAMLPCLHCVADAATIKGPLPKTVTLRF